MLPGVYGWCSQVELETPDAARIYKRKNMGRSDILTTMIYAHLAPDHLSKAVAKLPFSWDDTAGHSSLILPTGRKKQSPIERDVVPVAVSLLATVKKLICHSEIETTMIYAHHVFDHLAAVVNKRLF